MLHRVSRRVRDKAGLEWCQALASALQVSLAVMSVCGLFIGIAFQPMIHYMLAMSVSVSEYARRATAPAEARSRSRHLPNRLAPAPKVVLGNRNPILPRSGQPG